MEYINKQALSEAVKEFFRVEILAVLPVLYASYSNGQFHWDMPLIYGALFIGALKFADRYVHKDPEIKTNGILPF